MVKSFSEADIRDSIELRGTLEGLAARFAAERGVPSALLDQARACLERIDAAIAEPELSGANFSIYVSENDLFHVLLREMSASPTIAAQIERMACMPFVSPSAFVKVNATEVGSRDLLIVAQHQHRNLLEAIAQREGLRAEGIAREHARIAQGKFQTALMNRDGLRQVVGGKLISLSRARPL
jgi:GntR family transcriptional regulator of vanillate catabolism